MRKIGGLALSVSLTLASSPKGGAKSTCLSLRERWICEAKDGEGEHAKQKWSCYTRLCNSSIFMLEFNVPG